MKPVLRLVDDPAPRTIENCIGNLHVPSNRKAVKKNCGARRNFSSLPSGSKERGDCRCSSRWSVEPGHRPGGEPVSCAARFARVATQLIMTRKSPFDPLKDAAKYVRVFRDKPFVVKIGG